MAGVTEKREWTTEVYQLETTDPVLGGPEGVSNLPHKHLANRTQWLRQKILSETQTVIMRDDDGYTHHMVWIPRLTLLPNQIAEGVPSQALRLGGFLVDKYACSELALVGGALKAVSRPLAPPMRNIAWATAKALATQRSYGGRPCHIMTIREWGHLAWIVRLLGHDLRGNLAYGRDPRDPDEWSHFAESGDPTFPHYAGTGPLSWFHHGLPGGVADLLGNVFHMLDPIDVSLGTLTVVHAATLVNSITDSDPSFEIEDPAGYYSPFQGFRNWPATNGLLMLDTGMNLEFVVYGALVPTPGQPHRATVTDCLRGQYGSVPRAHDAGVPCDNRVYHCLIPSGYAAYVADDGLNNSDPGQATFAWQWGMFAHGTRDATPAPGDVLAIGDEDLLVNAVNGQQMTVTRGHNGTPIAPHPNGYPFASYSPQMERVAQGRQFGYATGPVRTHPDLEPLYLPGQVTTQFPSGDAPAFQIVLKPSGPVPICRGESFTYSRPATMLDLFLPHHLDFPSALAGFRACWTPADYQYGGATP